MNPSETFTELAAHLTPERRDHIWKRLCDNQIGWLTTVRPDGRPDTVAVWYHLHEDGDLVVYSEPGKIKLRNIAGDPFVTLVLDETDLGRDVIRFEGTARFDPAVPPPDELPGYVPKYADRIDVLFGTPRAFAEMFSEPIRITPTRLRSIDSDI